MINKRIIPMLMLHDGLLFKSKQFKQLTYIGDPLVAVKIFNEKEAQEICIVDIDPGRSGTGINFELLKNIAGECFMPLSYGGGIKSISDIRKILYSGFEKVILNSEIHSNPQLLKDAVAEFGSSSIIGCIDYKEEKEEGVVYIKNAQLETKWTLVEYAKHLEINGVGELLLNNITRDGAMKGLNNSLVQKIANCTSIPIISGGGVGSLSDVKDGFKSGVDAIAVGSLFVYKGSLKAVLINYPDESVINNMGEY
jgi:cyclase